jgi:hypothetical protein
MKVSGTRIVSWILARIPVLATACLLAGCTTTKVVGHFSDQGLSPWKEQVFGLRTRYELVAEGKTTVLRANSRQSASALYQRVEVDLDKTPYLTWRWKVEGTLGELDEQMKVGDDFAARLYVVVSPMPFRLKPRSLNYVWASNTPAGGHWESPYTPNVILVALQSGNARAGQWVREKHNVREDLRRYFGEDIRYVEAIAIMTDTDNSQSAATAYYGDISFTAQ